MGNVLHAGGSATIEAAGQGRFTVGGVLNAGTVKAVLERSRSLFPASGEFEVDLAAVTQGDSAGLALLIEWLRQAHERSQQLRLVNIPQQIAALARISDVEELLGLPREAAA